jgi:protein translocase SecG subunit
MTGLEITLVIVSILLIAVVLLQQRSVGLGGAFGGDSAVFVTRRGAEKSLYRLTILLGVILCSLILWSSYISRPQTTVTPVDTATPTATNQ